MLLSDVPAWACSWPWVMCVPMIVTMRMAMPVPVIVGILQDHRTHQIDCQADDGNQQRVAIGHALGRQQPLGWIRPPPPGR